jgi:hypothetical protein
MIFAMYVSDIPERLWRRRFFSSERKSLEKISRALQGRAR